MYRLTKEIVVAEFEPGGKEKLHEAMFKAIGRDYNPSEVHTLYRFEGLEVSILNRDLENRNESI